MTARNEQACWPGNAALSDMLGAPRNWLELVEQIGLLEELIADLHGTGDGGDGFVLGELARLLVSRRESLRAWLDAGAL